ncbi:hypothetical protein M8C13_06340 [Crossiella sp. SN42]|uniref:hypothetical protein n=1 Tax=Crossiella sp. SN42 TaxID=2944808 RepID=UPI00207C57D0|nr:hypothetical protein [Crossiella sp. SN42]MCO1575379.1 hypothetical protein [Crossiella sp. SN42]
MPTFYRHRISDIFATTNQVLKHGDDASVARLARQEIPRQQQAIETLLDEHELEQDGNCPRCLDRRRWWRLARWLPGRRDRGYCYCHAYRRAFQALDPELKPVGPHGRHGVHKDSPVAA